MNNAKTEILDTIISEALRTDTNPRLLEEYTDIYTWLSDKERSVYEERLMDRKLMKFRDQWNPMRFAGYLMKNLDMPKDRALKVAAEYEIMYDNLIQGYEIYNKTKHLNNS